MVEISVKLPDHVAERFGNNPQMAARKLLESAALESYRSHLLSRGQIRAMLGLNWQQTEDFLALHCCERHYTKADLEDDAQTLSSLPAK